MRTIRRTTRFKKDYKREAKGRHRLALDERLVAVLTLLLDHRPLPESLHDHPLTGDWSDHRDRHLWPDLVLIYRKPDDEFLDLVRLGSHSALSLWTSCPLTPAP